jgi:pyruvate/oxaloacetate carboxyltransferase
MITTACKLSVSAAIFFLIFMQQPAFAEHAPVPAVGAVLLGFQLPDLDPEALAEKVDMLRTQLIERREVLTRSLEEKKLGSSDALIAAIIPGGLLYAGYKELRYESAKDELARLNAEIDEIGNDLLAVQAMSAPAAVAQAY